MWEDFKDYVLFLLAVLSGLGLKDVALKYWKDHTAVRLECDIVPCIDQEMDNTLKTIFIIPDENWPRDEKVVNKIRVKAVNNGGSRILIQSGNVVYAGGSSSLQFHNTYRSDFQVHLEPLEPPKQWTTPIKLENACKLQKVYLVDSTGKQRRVSRKRVRELRSKARSIIADLASSDFKRNWLSSDIWVAHQIEPDDANQ